jgi:serine/threonine-protein kinase
VYLAEQLQLRSEFALKVFFGDFISNRKIAERFRREAMVASQIHHPNIVSVADYGSTRGGLTYLAMEYVRGETLSQIIKRDGPLSIVRTARIALDIARGLDAAHELGFVHRDLKPGNVIITGSQEEELAKILDFGLVGFKQARSDDSITEIGIVMGTATYMSPEQTQSSQVGPEADLYSLGIVMYEMLTGSPPFRDPTVQVVLTKQLVEPAPALPKENPLATIVASLLEKSPQLRMRGDDLQRELEALLDALDNGSTPGDGTVGIMNRMRRLLRTPPH